MPPRTAMLIGGMADVGGRAAANMGSDTLEGFKNQFAGNKTQVEADAAFRPTMNKYAKVIKVVLMGIVCKG